MKCKSVSYDMDSSKKFHSFVSLIVNLTNVLIVSCAVVNGITYVWNASLGSCFRVEKGNDGNVSLQLEGPDMFLFPNCNVGYEIDIMFVFIYFIINIISFILY